MTLKVMRSGIPVPVSMSSGVLCKTFGKSLGNCFAMGVFLVAVPQYTDQHALKSTSSLAQKLCNADSGFALFQIAAMLKHARLSWGSLL